MENIISHSPKCGEVIHEYVSGEDINTSVTCRGSRYVINISSLELHELDNYAPIKELILSKVKPERDALGPNPNNRKLKKRWWSYHAERREFYNKIRSRSKILVNCQVGPHLAFVFQPNDRIWSNTLNLYLLSVNRDFSVLQSRVHEVWARFCGSSMKDDLRYAPSDCFETFPFPPSYETDAALDGAGRTYHDHRAALMLSANEGMTKTYNHFHDAEERDAAIQTLRELHDEMDRAVLRAYGWHDLADELRPVFLTEETEDNHTYQGRYFWPADQRDRVLARLLALNAEQYAEEVAAGRAPTAQVQDDDAGALDDEDAGPLFERD